MDGTWLFATIAAGLLITACAPTATAPAATIGARPTAAALTPSPSMTPTRFPTTSRTAGPPTLTPLPTIPTFTPTFAVRTVITATPPPASECPRQNADLVPDLNLILHEQRFSLKEKPLLDYLSGGGSPDLLLRTLAERFKGYYRNPVHGVQQDATGDGVDDIILSYGYAAYVLKCEGGEYEAALAYSDEPGWIRSMDFILPGDMNLDGLPEIVMDEWGGHMLPSDRVAIFEWNGSEFSPILQGDPYGEGKHLADVDTLMPAKLQFADADGNGSIEMMFDTVIPRPIDAQLAHEIPWRDEKHTYAWDGELFVPQPVAYAPAEYRFQAIQDADLDVLSGKYPQAISIYQDAIFSNRLRPASREIIDNESAKAFARSGTIPFPTPVTPDPTEYPRLAAYAYYRMVVLHIYLGQMDAAQVKYATTQEKFPVGNPGHPYVEMATEFWIAYHSTGKMYDACAAAIQYADIHPEILTPLGSDYHGEQSHRYIPADVCPFR